MSTETLFRKVSVDIPPTKDGDYFICYNDNGEMILSNSEYSVNGSDTTMKGWWTGARNEIVYWLEPIPSQLGEMELLPTDDEIMNHPEIELSEIQCQDPYWIQAQQHRIDGMKLMRDICSRAIGKKNMQIVELIQKHSEAVIKFAETILLKDKKCSYDHSKLKLYGDPCPECGIIEGSDMK